MQNAILFPIWLLNLTFFNTGSIVKYYLFPTEHHSACLNNGCAFLAVRDMKAVRILFVCHLQMSLSIKYTHWSKNVPCCSHTFFNSSCKRHNHCCSQGTLSAQSRSLSLCFLICPFYATLVCVAFKQVQIQPHTGMRSSTWNATFCVIFLIRGCLVDWIMQNKCLTMRLPKPILATIAQLALICCP